MAKFASRLNDIRVARPCHANWSEMYGNHRRRFCGECKLHVYNLSGMTRTEAEDLIARSEGRVCVRFYRRADGSVMTQDCPVGLAKVRARARAIVTAAFSLIAGLFGGLVSASMLSERPEPAIVGAMEAVGKMERTLDHFEASNVDTGRDQTEYLMGNLAIVPKKQSIAKPKAREAIY